MRPGIAAWLQRDQRDGEQRQERDQRDEKRRDRPAEIAALFQPGELAAERDALACCALSLGHAVSGGRARPSKSTLRPLGHQRGDRVLRQALIGVLQRIGKGVGGVDHRLDQLEPVSASAQARIAGQR